MESQEAILPPHILIFPFPIQGHVHSMLSLAELLCLQNLDVTFIVSKYGHNRLLKHTDVGLRFGKYSGFWFETVSDGLPDDHPRTGEKVTDVLVGTRNVALPEFITMMEEKNFLASPTRRPVSCIIADGILSFAGDFAEEKGIPLIYFRTVGACSFWACFCMPGLIEGGDIPLKGSGMDEIVKNIPGMENFLRRRDLPSFCRVNDIDNQLLQIIKNDTRQTPRAQALILNTFEDLEGPILSQIRKHMPRLFSIGPSHSNLKLRLEAETTTKTSFSSSSFWEEDQSCIAWLDAQPPKSVLYVSFGSITVVTQKQLLEFWHGLVKSGQRFLWVVRPDSVNVESDEHQVTEELNEGTKARGYMVGWAPQVEVLNHPSVGGFLTHSGWNSTLESIVAGVPMLCWPYMVDQMINSRFVSEIWKVGLDMKDTCDRGIIEKMIRELMEVRKDEFLKRAEHMAEMTRKAITKGGSSYSNVDDLVEFLWSLAMKVPKNGYNPTS